MSDDDRLTVREHVLLWHEKHCFKDVKASLFTGAVFPRVTLRYAGNTLTATTETTERDKIYGGLSLFRDQLVALSLERRPPRHPGVPVLGACGEGRFEERGVA